MNCKELRRHYELEGPNKTCEHIRDALAEGHLQPSDFSLRDIAEECIPGGREWVRAMDPRSSGRRSIVLTEADGVDVTAFANITGQLIFSAIHQGYNQADFVCSRIIDTIPTRLDGEKIPGVEGLDPDGNEVVEPGMPFPHVGFGERYTMTPSTDKRGMIVPVTKEAIFFDRTALVLRNAAGVGEALGTNKEKRCADVVIGVVNNYNENGTAYNTYQSSTPWINTQGSTELNDWTDIDAAEQLLAGILDPTTGEPVTINSGAMTLLAMPAKNHTARRILGATETRSGDITSGDGIQTVAANTVHPYQLAISKHAYRRAIASGESATNSSKWWFLGDFKKAFAYMENWPITVVRAPVNSEAEFTQDIVARFKASERGVPAVMDPRYVTKQYQS